MAGGSRVRHRAGVQAQPRQDPRPDLRGGRRLVRWCIVIGATLGVAVFYGISLLMSLFGATPTFLSSSSALGIGFSFLVAGLAAFNLALDFDFIERGAKERLPESVEWYAAFGVLVTVVWLYLEILRLLAKLRDR
ncbi:MAG: Bax inhibitor-1/YccA family protein [Actinobacteria bacterium]|nr:Bax inhibitor-1/YccA family protein [Actinomycetota bacterium]